MTQFKKSDQEAGGLLRQLISHRTWLVFSAFGHPASSDYHSIILYFGEDFFQKDTRQKSNTLYLKACQIVKIKNV